MPSVLSAVFVTEAPRKEDSLRAFIDAHCTYAVCVCVRDKTGGYWSLAYVHLERSTKLEKVGEQVRALTQWANAPGYLVRKFLTVNATSEQYLKKWKDALNRQTRSPHEYQHSEELWRARRFDSRLAKCKFINRIHQYGTTPKPLVQGTIKGAWTKRQREDECPVCHAPAVEWGLCGPCVNAVLH
tara:strand:+ start:78 stop:632 length:555 start_codon:yes stop_codon:yes gene_type:complete